MDLDLQPILKGGLIDVRPLKPEHYEALFDAASDPLIWEQHPERDRYKRKVFQRFFDGAIESKGAFAVIHCETRRIIGSSRYYGYKQQPRQIAIGYTFLERAFWGGSYGPELKRLMLDHAFQFVDEVFFEVGEGNLRSQKALQKLGAQFVKSVELEGLYGNTLSCSVFTITRTRWTQRSRYDADAT